MDNQHLRFTQGQFTVTTDPAFFQLEAIHDYLSQSSWAPGIDAETVRISIQNSLCFVASGWNKTNRLRPSGHRLCHFWLFVRRLRAERVSEKWSWSLAD